MKRFGLSRRERLVRLRDFEATYRERNSAADSRLVLYAHANGLAHSRLGLSVSGRLGGAVARNRFKRVCREAFRLHKHELPPGFDLIVIPRRRLDVSVDEAAASLRELTARLCGTQGK